MRVSRAHFPGVVKALDIQGVTVLVVVHDFTEVVIRVASAQSFTGQSDVINVELRHARSSDRNSSELADHGADERNSYNREVLTHFVEIAGNESITSSNQLLFSSKDRVGLVLVEGVHPTISDGNSVRSDNLHVGMEEVVGDCWDVLSRIAFSHQVELSMSELRVLLVEINQEGVEVDSYLVFTDTVVKDGVSKAEAGTEGLVNEHNMSIIVPGVFVVGKDSTVLYIAAIVFEIIGAHLSVHTQHRGAARTSLEPDNERVNFLVSSGLSEKEVQRVVAVGLDPDVIRNQSVILEFNAVQRVPGEILILLFLSSN